MLPLNGGFLYVACTTSVKNNRENAKTIKKKENFIFPNKPNNFLFPKGKTEKEKIIIFHLNDR